MIHIHDMNTTSTSTTPSPFENLLVLHEGSRCIDLKNVPTEVLDELARENKPLPLSGREAYLTAYSDHKEYAVWYENNCVYLIPQIGADRAEALVKEGLAKAIRLQLGCDLEQAQAIVRSGACSYRINAAEWPFHVIRVALFTYSEIGWSYCPRKWTEGSRGRWLSEMFEEEQAQAIEDLSLEEMPLLRRVVQALRLA